MEKHIRLVAQVCRVTVLHVEHDPKMATFQTETVTSDALGYQQVTYYFGCRLGRIPALMFRLWLTLRMISRWMKSGAVFTLAHVHVAMPNVWVARWLKWRYGLPFVLSVHSSGFQPIATQRFPRWQRRLLVLAANDARAVMPVSHDLAEAWRQNGLLAPIRVVPNVVDTARFYPGADERPTPPVRLLHISNFHPQAKNVIGILKTAQVLYSEGFPFLLTIRGDGDWQSLQAQANALGLPASQCVIGGVCTEQEVADLMRAHHVFILFSNYETQGVTLLEAQCCGLLTIGTQVGGIPEVIHHPDLGYLVPPGDESALRAAIIASSTRTADAQTIAQQAASRYGKDVVLQGILEGYFGEGECLIK